MKALKKLDKLEIQMALQDNVINNLPPFDGELIGLDSGPLSLTCALEAQKEFWAECPTVVNHYHHCGIDLTGYEGVFVPGTDETEETHWVKECPAHEHDCWREGCGRAVSESYSFCGELVVLAPNGRLVVAAAFHDYVNGGYGI